jgi:hypothetical protein
MTRSKQDENCSINSNDDDDNDRVMSRLLRPDLENDTYGTFVCGFVDTRSKSLGFCFGDTYIHAWRKKIPFLSLSHKNSPHTKTSNEQDDG